MRYVELNLVKPTATREGITDHVALEEIPDGFFLERRGNIGIKVGRNKERSYKKEISEWDDSLQFLLNKGYYILPGKNTPSETKKIQRSTGDYSPEKDKDAEILINLLRQMSRQALSEVFSFNISVESLTEEQKDIGQEILDRLSDNYKEISQKEFNNELCHYYSIIPRRMKYLSDYLAHGKDKRGKALSEQEKVLEKGALLQKERDYFKNLLDLLEDNPVEENRLSCSETYGLSIRAVTDSEQEWILKKLDSLSNNYIRAWKVVNNKTENAFNQFCESEGLYEKHGIDHLFHGSRGENFWSIIKSGLTINPKDVVITGKAYGQGTYFAPSAHKSIGYTDRYGSKWAGGTRECGYLGIYRVATGKRYDGSLGCDHSLTWNKLQKICPGAHSTWAEARHSGFMMDEVIVYQDQQSTIEYLIEVGA